MARSCARGIFERAPQESNLAIMSVHQITSRLPALTIPTTQTRHAPIHHHHGGGVALAAERGAGGVVGLREGILLLVLRFEFGALLLDELFLVFVQAFVLDHADGFQVLFDDAADFGDQ